MYILYSVPHSVYVPLNIQLTKSIMFNRCCLFITGVTIITLDYYIAPPNTTIEMRSPLFFFKVPVTVYTGNLREQDLGFHLTFFSCAQHGLIPSKVRHCFSCLWSNEPKHTQFLILPLSYFPYSWGLMHSIFTMCLRDFLSGSTGVVLTSQSR